jgi:hypothetical protein
VISWGRLEKVEECRRGVREEGKRADGDLRRALRIAIVGRSFIIRLVLSKGPGAKKSAQLIACLCIFIFNA